MDAGLTPTPEGADLTLDLECRHDPASASGPRHPVTIHADWSVTTPHDLDAERVATAFGAYVSCVSLVDVAVPALRRVLPVLLRREPLALERTRTGWRPPRARRIPRCCGATTFEKVEDAARHLRSPEHVARRAGALEWQLTALIRAARTAWRISETEAPAHDGAERIVREPVGVATLWRAGVHPDRLAGLAASVGLPDVGLPVTFFLGSLHGTSDLEWCARVLRHHPDPDAAAALVWLDSPQDVLDPDAVGAWLALGVPLHDAILAADAHVPAAEAAHVARVIRAPRGIAARDITHWLAVGCRPSAEHFAALHRAGVERDRPSAAAIDSLAAAMGADADRTDLAVALALLGTRDAVLRQLRVRPPSSNERAS